MEANKNYCSFFLRLKQLQTADLQTWVISVQDIHTGRQQIFPNLDALIQFLQTEFGDVPAQMDSGPSVTQGAKVIPA